MIIDIRAMLSIVVLFQDPQRLIFELQKKLIIQMCLLKIDLKAQRFTCLMEKLKVEIQEPFFKVGESQFDLYMRVDTNTNGHRQWFYFSVRNLLPGTVKFNIYRFKKKFSLFQRGMKPYVLSVKSKKGWRPGCNKIFYRIQKNHQNRNQAQNLSFYLSFQYKFQEAEDQVYFSSGLPYTVNYLNKRLNQFCGKFYEEIAFQVNNNSKTLCGQNLPIVTIGPKNKQVELKEPNILNYIIINARTHPGETSSSWVLDGLLQKLLNSQEIRRWIVQNNICFKILPMLNPDGVFMGNYRTGVIGEDFNRKFATGKKQLFPEIQTLRKLISDCKKLGRVFLFLDLHGHSILKNSFIYGPSETLFSSHPLRNLPFILWHNTKYFKLNSCKFKFNKDMAQTARLYFQIKQSILTYTCQISLGLYYSGMHTFQMMEDDYRMFGGSIITSIVEMMRKQKMVAYQGFEYEIMSHNRTIQFVDKSKQEDKIKFHTKEMSKIKQKQTKVQSVSVSKRQNKRETCIEKIKNIKKQLVEEEVKKQKQKQKEKEKEKEKQEKQKNNVRQKDKGKIIKEKEQKKFDSRDISLSSKAKPNFSQQIKSNFKYSLGATFYNSNFKDYNYKPNISNFYFNTPASTHVIETSLRNTQEDQSLIRAGRVSKTNKQTQFKIRRKPDIFKVIPDSIRKKLGIKMQMNLSNTKHLMEEPQFAFERAATFDSSYLSNQIHTVQETIKQREQSEDMLRQEMELNIIDEKFSEEYQSMNDSDNSSEDLTYKEKQYIIECLKNNKKMKTNNEEQQQSQGMFTQNYNQEQKYEEAIFHYPTTININGFKQIRFKSIQGISNGNNGNKLQMRTTKRQIYKFRDYTHKSLGKNLYEQQSSMMPQMIQKKQLNERISSTKKSVREPYYLVQINKKYHQSNNNLSITK